MEVSLFLFLGHQYNERRNQNELPIPNGTSVFGIYAKGTKSNYSAYDIFSNNMAKCDWCGKEFEESKLVELSGQRYCYACIDLLPKEM